jgi:hypothetical protein
MQPLFRKEAMQSGPGSHLGSVQLKTELTQTCLALMSAMFLIGLIALLLTGTFSRKAHLKGEIVSSGATVQSASFLQFDLNKNKTEAHFLVPAVDLRYLSVGMPVAMIYDGLPSGKGGLPQGHVYAIRPISGLMSKSGDIELLVSLPSQNVMIGKKEIWLLPGMHVTGIITLERRTALSWLVNSGDSI